MFSRACGFFQSLCQGRVGCASVLSIVPHDPGQSRWRRWDFVTKTTQNRGQTLENKGFSSANAPEIGYLLIPSCESRARHSSRIFKVVRRMPRGTTKRDAVEDSIMKKMVSGRPASAPGQRQRAPARRIRPSSLSIKIDERGPLVAPVAAIDPPPGREPPDRPAWLPAVGRVTSVGHQPARRSAAGRWRAGGGPVAAAVRPDRAGSRSDYWSLPRVRRREAGFDFGFTGTRSVGEVKPAAAESDREDPGCRRNPGVTLRRDKPRPCCPT